jgi:amino acid permease
MVRGYEKAWAALLAGGAVATMQVLALWGMSLFGAIPAPESAQIASAVTGLVSAIAAAAGAYIATTSAPMDQNSNLQVGVPMPTADETANK